MGVAGLSPLPTKALFSRGHDVRYALLHCHGRALGAPIKALRNVLPILLLVTFVLPPCAPLLALGQSREANLPACCRRNGKHHCAMSMAERQQVWTQVTAPKWAAPLDRCPYCPASVISNHPRESDATLTAQAFYVASAGNPAGIVQTESKRRISRDRSRQKRGPPSQTIL
jgi:hypothetical protein